MATGPGLLAGKEGVFMGGSDLARAEASFGPLPAAALFLHAASLLLPRTNKSRL
jgi:hypothetical protein